MVVNCAHRGASGTHPENTLAAFKRAVEIGVDMIEFDVWPTKDEWPILMHDAAVDRTTNGSGPIAEKTLEEIKALDAGAWKGGEFAGERVPTLAEALRAIPADVALNIHVKKLLGPNSLYVERFTAALDEFDAAGRSYIAPDDLEALPILRAWRPDVNLILLDNGAPDADYVALAEERRIKTLQPGRARMSKDFMDLAHRHGLRANVFYADTVEDMKAYIDMGVDGILTNYPERLRELLGNP